MPLQSSGLPDPLSNSWQFSAGEIGLRCEEHPSQGDALAGVLLHFYLSILALFTLREVS